MKIAFRLVGICLVLILTSGAGTADAVHKIELPEETEIYRSSGLPGAAFANAFCLTCHSVEYVKYQPTSSPRAYWQATVTKMQKTFGAPIPDAQIEPIVDYLVKTYGAETGRPVPLAKQLNSGKR